MALHVVFGLFFALAIVSLVRGAWRCTLLAHSARGSARAGALRCPRRRSASTALRGASRAMTEPIAIVGMACRYPDAAVARTSCGRTCSPGGARSGGCPPSGCALDDYWSADPHAPDALYATEAAVIEGYEFDRVALPRPGSHATARPT